MHFAFTYFRLILLLWNLNWLLLKTAQTYFKIDNNFVYEQIPMNIYSFQLNFIAFYGFSEDFVRSYFELGQKYMFI